MDYNLQKKKKKNHYSIHLKVTQFSKISYRWGEGARFCPTLRDPTDCSSPGSSIHGIFQARVLEWGAISFSRGSSQQRDQTRVSCFTVWATKILLFISKTLKYILNSMLQYSIHPLFRSSANLIIMITRSIKYFKKAKLPRGNTRAD